MRPKKTKIPNNSSPPPSFSSSLSGTQPPCRPKSLICGSAGPRCDGKPKERCSPCAVRCSVLNQAQPGHAQSVHSKSEERVLAKKRSEQVRWIQAALSSERRQAGSALDEASCVIAKQLCAGSSRACDCQLHHAGQLPYRATRLPILKLCIALPPYKSEPSGGYETPSVLCKRYALCNAWYG
eukprot:1176489-Rhodomonas_salina.1